MNLKRSKLHVLRQRQDLSDRAKSGVSLHCHTQHSHEMLDFVPDYAARIPLVSLGWKYEKARYERNNGRSIDFSTAYWSPPFSGQEVYESEKTQIENNNLRSMVSITDHDCIDANMSIEETDGSRSVPISMEWTVPYDIGYFHVGVHNLPRDRAVELTKILLDFTFNKEHHNKEHLNQMFSMLNDLPQVLVILNHPIWDIEMVGKERHAELLNGFIRDHGHWIHALEVNGFRSWSENKEVIELAESMGIPVAAGGDRHGCQPNTVLNLTGADTFEEFVRDIREKKTNEVALMPEYEIPLHSRQFHSFSEILKFYPEFPEHRRRWVNRVFYDNGKGQGLVPLSYYGWEFGGPKWLRASIWTLGFLGSPKLRPLFRLIRRSADRVPSDIGIDDSRVSKSDEINDQALTSGTA